MVNARSRESSSRKCQKQPPPLAWELAPNDSPSPPKQGPKKRSASLVSARSHDSSSRKCQKQPPPQSNARASILDKAARLAAYAGSASPSGTASSRKIPVRTPASRNRARSPAALRSDSCSSTKHRKRAASSQTGFDVVCDRIKGTLEELAVKSPPVSASRCIAHASTQLLTSFRDSAKFVASTSTDTDNSGRRTSRKRGQPDLPSDDPLPTVQRLDMVTDVRSATSQSMKRLCIAECVSLLVGDIIVLVILPVNYKTPEMARQPRKDLLASF